MYGTFCAVMTLHVFFCFPETKDKRLEEIGQMWDEKVPAWRSASWTPTIPVLSEMEMDAKPEVEYIEKGSVSSREP